MEGRTKSHYKRQRVQRVLTCSGGRKGGREDKIEGVMRMLGTLETSGWHVRGGEEVSADGVKRWPVVRYTVYLTEHQPLIPC